MPTKKIYNPLGEDEDINEVTMISQSVDALDAAGMLYFDTKNAEGMLQVASGYLQVSKYLGDLRDANLSVEGTSHGGKRSVDTHVKVGFTIPDKENNG